MSNTATGFDEPSKTVDEIIAEARDKYTVHNCNECNWRKSCFGCKFGDSECLKKRQNIFLMLGIEDGYFTELLNNIEAAWKREKAEIEASALAAGGIVEASSNKDRGKDAAAQDGRAE